LWSAHGGDLVSHFFRHGGLRRSHIPFCRCRRDLVRLFYEALAREEAVVQRTRTVRGKRSSDRA
jgi:hypothetical protein